MKERNLSERIRFGFCHPSQATAGRPPVWNIVACVLFVLPTLTSCVAEISTDDSDGHFAAQRLGLRQLEQVSDFGTNPGGLTMFEYAPADIPTGPRPLVVALHGCSQTATEYMNTGWNEVADELGFYVLYPQQSAQNNQLKCFNWGGGWPGMPSATVPDSTRVDLTYVERGVEENMSIIEMIDHMSERYEIDDRRVYVTGVSAGGGMASLMLALWPDVFAGGAIIAGIPYGCNFEQQTTGEAKRCMQNSVNRTPEQWGDYVRSAYGDHDGSRPLVAVWHGTSDGMVNYSRLTENVEQWTNVHGIDATPDATQSVGRVTLDEHTDSDGTVVVRAYTVQNMAHGVPVYPAENCGSTHWSLLGSFFHAVGVCAARENALFWGLDEEPSSTTPPDGGTPDEEDIDDRDTTDGDLYPDEDGVEDTSDSDVDGQGEAFDVNEDPEIRLGCQVVISPDRVGGLDGIRLLLAL